MYTSSFIHEEKRRMDPKLNQRTQQGWTLVLWGPSTCSRDFAKSGNPRIPSESGRNLQEILKLFGKVTRKNRPKFDPGIPWSPVESLHFLDGHQRWVHGATFCGEGAAGMVMFSWFGGFHQ